MSTKTDQITLLKKLEPLVKNFRDTYDKFIKEWSNVYDEINFDIWDSKEYQQLLILKSLEEYHSAFLCLKEDLKDFLDDFNHSTLLK